VTTLPERIEAWAERRRGRLRAPTVLTIRTLKDSIEDRVPGLAAEAAFYLILSLPPLLLTMLASIGVVGNALVPDFEARTIDRVREFANAFLTSGATSDLVDIVERVLSQASLSVLSIGFVLTLLTASRAFRVMTVAITIAYDLRDQRPGWHQFAYGLGLTVSAILIGVIVVPVFVAGPPLGEAIGSWFGLEDEFVVMWRIAYWPAAAVVVTLLIATLYHVAAPWWTPWRRDLPGAVLAMIIALLGSVGLRFYAAEAISSEAAFQPIAAPLVILVWLYVMALAVLLGAELNAEIERYWPTDEPAAADPAVAPRDESDERNESDESDETEVSSTDPAPSAGRGP
jgi:membrane protein